MAFDSIYIDYVDEAQRTMKELHEMVKKKITDLTAYSIRLEEKHPSFFGEEYQRVEAELGDIEEFSSLVDEIVHKLQWLKEDWL